MKNSQIHPRLWGRVVSARAIADKKFKCNDDEAGVAPHQAARLCELTLGDNLVRPLRRPLSRRRRVLDQAGERCLRGLGNVAVRESAAPYLQMRGDPSQKYRALLDRHAARGGHDDLQLMIGQRDHVAPLPKVVHATDAGAPGKADMGRSRCLSATISPPKNSSLAG